MKIIMNALHVQSCQCQLCGLHGQNNGHHNNGVSASYLMHNAAFNCYFRRYNYILSLKEMGMSLGAEYAQRAGGGKFPMVDRRTVSDYALTHGGTVINYRLIGW